MSRNKFIIFLFAVLICIIVFESLLLVLNYFNGNFKIGNNDNVQPTQAQLINPTINNEPTSTEPVYPTWASKCINGEVKFDFKGTSKSVIAQIKASMPKMNGMRFFYMNDAQITDNVTANYGSANCDGPYVFSGHYNYSGGVKISFMQGFWGKGGSCDFDMNVDYKGQSVSVCGNVIDITNKGGDNSYTVYLVGPSKSQDITYEIELNFTGHYTNTEIENILKDVVELK